MRVHISVEKAEYQGMNAVLAETVYLKIPLRTMGTIDPIYCTHLENLSNLPVEFRYLEKLRSGFYL